MITLVLYNLYISICEKRKAGFSLYLYAHQRSATKHFSETLWQTICSIAAMCLMWALDTKQTLIVGKRQLMFCQSLPMTLTSLILSACLLVVAPCVCKCPTRLIWVGGLWNRWNLWSVLLTDGQLLQMLLLDV